MNNRSGAASRVIEGRVQGHFLGGRITIDKSTRLVKPAQPTRIKAPKAGSRGRNKQPTITSACGDVAGTATGQSPVK